MGWFASDGSEHETELARDYHQKHNLGGVGGGSDKTMAAGGMALVAIFIIGPIIAAKIVGFLWGLLLKLGIVGKIISTILMVIIGPLILAYILPLTGELLNNINQDIGVSIIVSIFVGSAILLPVWYFFWHYDLVKEMGASTFSEKIKKFAMFTWFGFIGSMIVGLAMGIAEFGGILAIGSLIAGIVYYIIATKSYANNITRGFGYKFRWIALIIAFGLTTAFGIGATTWERNDRAGVVTAKPAKSEEQREDVLKYSAGRTFTVSRNIKLFEVANEYSTVIKELSKDDRVISTGEVLFHSILGIPYVSVEHNGTKGWVFGGYLY